MPIEPCLEECEARGRAARRASSRRTRTPTTCPGTDGSRSSTGIPVRVHPLAEPGYPFEPLEDGGRIQVGAVALTRRPHARAPARALLLRRHGHGPGAGAVARPDGRLALRRRRGTAGSRGRGRAKGQKGSTRACRRLLAARGRRRGLPRARRGLALRSRHELEGVDDDRLRAALQPHARPATPLEEFIGESTGGTGLRPPNIERDRRRSTAGPFVGAPPPLERARRGGRRGRARRPRRRRRSQPVTSRGRSTCRCRLVELRDEGGVHRLARGADRALRVLVVRTPRRPPGGCAPSGSSTSPACSATATRPERLEPIGIDELERLLAENAVDVVDVREADERDDGYIPGSRHIPFRLIRALGDERPGPGPAGGDHLRERLARRDRGERPGRVRCRRAPRARRRGSRRGSHGATP